MSDNKSTLSLLPLHYEGHRVRTFLDAQGHLWWIAEDVAQVLGLANIRKNLTAFPANEKGVTTGYTLGGIQDMVTLNEPGLYRLIFQSRKPEAEALKLWVFHEVLPTLHRTGTYTVPQEPAPLTAQGQLPPPPVRIREHAEISEHLLRVWCLLRDTREWLSNREVAVRANVAPRTARAHTHYLVHLGMLDCQEAFPRHLFRVAATADRRNAGVYQRLNLMAEIVHARQAW